MPGQGGIAYPMEECKNHEISLDAGIQSGKPPTLPQRILEVSKTFKGLVNSPREVQPIQTIISSWI